MSYSSVAKQISVIAVAFLLPASALAALPPASPPAYAPFTNFTKSLSDSAVKKIANSLAQSYPRNTPAAVQGSSGSGGGGGGIGFYGGTVAPIMICDEGLLYAVVGMPYSGPLMWIPGVSSVPPYKNSFGTPPFGFSIGHHSVAPVPCTIAGIIVMLAPVMYGYGASI